MTIVTQKELEEKRVIWMKAIFSEADFPYMKFYYIKDLVDIVNNAINWKETPCQVFTNLYHTKHISCHASLFAKFYKWDLAQKNDGFSEWVAVPMPDDIFNGKFHITNKGLELLKNEFKNHANMANTSNECSGLKVNMEHAPDFTRVLEMQNELQEKIMPGFYNREESLTSIANFLMYNKHALDDEFSEAMDALGGIKDGVGSGVWKWWKKSHVQAETMTIADLSENDLKELKFEMVDQFFFFLNQVIKIGMTGDELYSLYKAKWQENMDRQNNNY